MKKITPNQIVNVKNRLFTLPQNLSLTLKRVLLILLFAFSFANLSAQNGKTKNPAIMEVNNYISSLKISNQKTTGSNSNSQYVENLVFGIQPAIYFQSGIAKNYGDIPVKLFTDVASLNSIANATIVKDAIEIVVVNIKNKNDLNSKIDLSQFSNFSALKYIYIISSVETAEANILNMFSNFNGQYTVFYKIEIAE